MTTPGKNPWHLWLVGILALLWMSGGMWDFIATQSGYEPYLSQFSPQEREFFTDIPGWAVFFWGLSIGTGVLGTICLLLRSRFTVPLYWISLVSFIIVSLQNYVLATPTMAQVVGGFAVGFSVVIFAVIVLLLVYTMRMRTVGVLR